MKRMYLKDFFFINFTNRISFIYQYLRTEKLFPVCSSNNTMTDDDIQMSCPAGLNSTMTYWGHCNFYFFILYTVINYLKKYKKKILRINFV